MIQDILPHKLHNMYESSMKATEDSIIICFRGNDVLIREELLPQALDFKMLNLDSLIYLFTVDEEKRYFLLEDIADDQIPEGYIFVNIRGLRKAGISKKYRMFAIYTAIQLANWYRNNKFCGRCGKPTFLDDKERAIRCTCGNIIYPRIVPAVIVGVLHEDKLLVTKYRTGFAFYALIAGFTEIGETLEENVAREVMEEAGLKVKSITYYKSQPWGIVDDLLAGFFCEVDGDPTIHMDEGELGVAKWVSPEEIELQPDDFSLTNEMMTLFKERRLPELTRPQNC